MMFLVFLGEEPPSLHRFIVIINRREFGCYIAIDYFRVINIRIGPKKDMHMGQSAVLILVAVEVTMYSPEYMFGLKNLHKLLHLHFENPRDTKTIKRIICDTHRVQIQPSRIACDR